MGRVAQTPLAAVDLLSLLLAALPRPLIGRTANTASALRVSLAALGLAPPLMFVGGGKPPTLGGT